MNSIHSYIISRYVAVYLHTYFHMYVPSKKYSFSAVETPAKVVENVEQRNRLESVEDNLPKVVISPIKAFPDKQVYSLQKIITKVPRLCSNRLKGFWAFDRLSQITMAIHYALNIYTY